MYWNSDEVNLFLGKNKDVDKNHWLSYLDQEAIPGERNWFLWQISFVKLGNGFLHAFLYYCVNLKKKMVKVSFVYCLLYFIWMNQFQFNLHIFLNSTWSYLIYQQSNEDVSA